jgi:hypothetical protein
VQRAALTGRILPAENSSAEALSPERFSMSRFVQSSFAMTLFLGIVLASTGCRQATVVGALDRQTALSLLRADPAASYRGLTWSVPLTIYAVSPLKERAATLLQSLTPDLLILRQQTDVPDPNPSFFENPFAAKPIVKRYDFALTKPQAAAPGAVGPNALSLRLADADFKQVTGIFYQGDEALVEVLVAYTPNETYRRIEKALAAVEANGPIDPDFELPDAQAVGTTVTQGFGFRRYDGEWRLQV